MSNLLNAVNFRDAEIRSLKGEPIDRPGVMWYHAIIDKDDKDLEYVGEDRRKISL